MVEGGHEAKVWKRQENRWVVAGCLQYRDLDVIQVEAGVKLRLTNLASREVPSKDEPHLTCICLLH